MRNPRSSAESSLPEKFRRDDSKAFDNSNRLLGKIVAAVWVIPAPHLIGSTLRLADTKVLMPQLKELLLGSARAAFLPKSMHSGPLHHIQSEEGGLVAGVFLSSTPYLRCPIKGC